MNPVGLRLLKFLRNLASSLIASLSVRSALRARRRLASLAPYGVRSNAKLLLSKSEGERRKEEGGKRKGKAQSTIATKGQIYCVGKQPFG